MKDRDAFVSLAIKVTPKARRRGVTGVRDGVVLVSVGAAPERGRATEEALEIVAIWLGLPRSRVRLAAGPTSRAKRLEITGISAPDLQKRLAELVAGTSRRSG